MAIRTLVAGRPYFGLHALVLQRGAERTTARLGRATREPILITSDTLREDFQLNEGEAASLLRSLVGAGLLIQANNSTGYRPTEAFQDFATAKVIPALTRNEAGELLDQVARLALDINTSWHRNPLRIGALAVSGSYLKHASKVPELLIWVVVRARRHIRGALLKQPLTRAEGAQQIRAAIRALGPHIMVRSVVDSSAVEQPFCTIYDADTSEAQPHSTMLLRDWSELVRRRLASRRDTRATSQ